MAIKYNNQAVSTIVYSGYNMLDFNNFNSGYKNYSAINGPELFYNGITSSVIVFGMYSLSLATNTNYIVKFKAYIDTTDNNLYQGLDVDLWPDDLPQFNLPFSSSGITNVPKEFSFTFNSSSSSMSSCQLRFFIDFSASSGYKVVAPLHIYDIRFYKENEKTNRNISKIVKNGVVVWEQPHTLTISVSGSSYLSSYSVSRTSTSEPTASTGTLSSGAIIYNDDNLSASVSATGTTYSSWNPSSLSSPSVSATSSSQIYVYNPNSVSCTIYYGTSSGSTSSSISLGGGSSTTISGLLASTTYYFFARTTQTRNRYDHSANKSWTTLVVDGNESITFTGTETTSVESNTISSTSSSATTQSSASWHTVWSGSTTKSIGTNITVEDDPYEGFTDFSLTASSSIPSGATLRFSGVANSYNSSLSELNNSYSNHTFTDRSYLSYSKTESSTIATIISQCAELYVSYSGTTINFYGGNYRNRYDRKINIDTYQCYTGFSVTITKVEAYY